MSVQWQQLNILHAAYALSSRSLISGTWLTRKQKPWYLLCNSPTYQLLLDNQVTRLHCLLVTEAAQVLFAVQNKKVQAWTAWWGRNPLTGKAYLHVNVPPRAQKAFKSCHLWQMLPGAYFA